MKHFIYIIICTAFFFNKTVLAQQWEVGAHAGITGFMGDINPSNPLYFKSGFGGINTTYNINSTWGFQLSYNYIHLHATDFDDKNSYRHARDQAFSNKVNEISLRANFNFFRFIAGRELNKYTPYIFAGLTGITHNPYVKLKEGGTIKLKDLELQENNNIRKTALTIPFGVGFKYNMKGPWSLGAEIGYRTSFNNDLDNVSNNYPNADQVNNIMENPNTTPGGLSPNSWLAIAFPTGKNPADYYGKPKGDGGTRDGYMTAGITLTFTFISPRCYWWN